MRRILVVGPAAIVCTVALGVAAAPRARAAADLREQAARARKKVDGAQAELTKGFARLQEARAEGRAGRIGCVNSALTQMKGLMRLADNSLLELEEAEAASNAATVARSSTKISVLTKKIANAFRRLRSCMGEVKKGDVIGTAPLITVEPDPDLPSVDPTEGLKDLSPQLETPPSASPYFK